MASAEIAPLSKNMTPKICITITSAMKIMIMQLIVAKYYYSWKVSEFLFYLTKPKFKPFKNKPVEWRTPSSGAQGTCPTLDTPLALCNNNNNNNNNINNNQTLI